MCVSECFLDSTPPLTSPERVEKILLVRILLLFAGSGRDRVRVLGWLFGGRVDVEDGRG